MKKTLIAAFIIIGILIGAFITAHFRTNVPVGSLYPTDVLQAREDLISDYVGEQKIYQAQIASLHQDIEKIQKENEAAAGKSTLSDLENLKKKIGLTSVEGEGVEIILDDSQSSARNQGYSSDKNYVQASDLRDIINLLWANRATGVAVNGQRIISTTPIASAGNSILVNNVYIVPPVSITAVADPALIQARIQDANVFPDLKARISQGALRFQFIIKSMVALPIYSGDLKYKNVRAKPNE